MAPPSPLVLRHKRLVALAWLAVAIAGILTIGGTVHRMTNDFSLPGQSFRVDNQIAAQYGNGGSQSPYVAVLTRRAGRADHRPRGGRAGRAGLRRDLAGRPACPHRRLRVTGSRAFVTTDDRTTYALVYTAPVTGFGGPDVGPAIQAAP